MSTVLDLIGNTPLIEITKINPFPDVKIFAKLEGQNPGGSVKDRASLNMVRGAIDRGDLKPGMKLIEATSGNTGIALAMIARLFEYDIELVLPSNSTKERVSTMEAYGARVVLLEGIEACRDYAEKKATEPGYYMLDQFANSDNYLAHYKTTGPELWDDTAGLITHFVSSMGTTGTIMGSSKYLKEKNSSVQIVGCQPVEGASIPGIRRWPKEYLPKIYDASRVDKIIDISEQDAVRRTRQLAREEGIFAGMSSGGALHAALEVGAGLNDTGLAGLIVFICCDRGDRYLSSSLFTDLD